MKELAKIGFNFMTDVAPSALPRYATPHCIASYYRYLRDPSRFPYQEKVEEIERQCKGDQRRVDDMTKKYVNSTYNDCKNACDESGVIVARAALDAHDSQRSCLVCSPGSLPSSSRSPQKRSLL
jgi:hypothetical protein